MCHVWSCDDDFQVVANIWLACPAPAHELAETGGGGLAGSMLQPVRTDC